MFLTSFQSTRFANFGTDQLRGFDWIKWWVTDMSPIDVLANFACGHWRRQRPCWYKHLFYFNYIQSSTELNRGILKGADVLWSYWEYYSCCIIKISLYTTRLWKPVLWRPLLKWYAILRFQKWEYFSSLQYYMYKKCPLQSLIDYYHSFI